MIINVTDYKIKERVYVSDLSMVVSDVPDLLEGLELEGSVFVDGRPDVVAVGRVLHLLQLPHAGHVGQSQLYIRLTWNLN